MARAAGWATWAEVRGALRLRWERGDLLRARLAGVPQTPLELPVRGPTSRQVADRFADVGQWVDGWTAARLGPAHLEWREVGGRLVGANRVPARTVWESEADLWTTLGVRDEVWAFDALVELTEIELPAALGFVHDRPHQALAAAHEWPRLLAVVLWVVEFGGPHVYLRQIDVPGVDTKFVEGHRSVLAALLGRVLPAARIDPGTAGTDLVRRFGLRGKPQLIRFRSADGPYRELAVRVEDLAAHPFAARSVVIVENDITYLAFPTGPGVAVVYGGGYEVSVLAALPWLADRDVVYWGDIDTHGFRALDRLRSFVPAARSMLMDEPTLLAHRTHWSTEPVPVTDHLARLTPAETACYLALVRGEHGEQVRLEQERIRFGVVERAATAAFAAQR